MTDALSSDSHCWYVYVKTSNLMTDVHQKVSKLFAYLDTGICDYYSCSEVKASVPGTSINFGEWLIDWLIDWVCDFSPLASSAMEVATEIKFGTEVA